MQLYSIKGSQRESVGKSATKALRNAGQIPCVVYGGDKPVHFSAPEGDFRNLIYTPNVYIVAIDVDGKEYKAVLQDIQFHPVSDKILHVDFYQVFDDKDVTMTIPVRIVGNSIGVRNGGSIRFNARKLKVRGLPGKLPDFIEADISELAIGNKLYVTALAKEDYKILNPENTVVVQVRMSRAAMKNAQAATEAEAEG